MFFEKCHFLCPVFTLYVTGNQLLVKSISDPKQKQSISSKKLVNAASPGFLGSSRDKYAEAKSKFLTPNSQIWLFMISSDLVFAIP